MDTCRRLTAACFALAVALLCPAAAAQSCVPAAGVDWMVVDDPMAPDIRPPDCAEVAQSPPDFRWPDVAGGAGYALTLTYPDGRQQTLPAARNWANWDEVLPAGTYVWSVRPDGGPASAPRRFTVGAAARPFLVPPMSAVLARVAARPHPRFMPERAAAEQMVAQRWGAIEALFADVGPRIGRGVPADGRSAGDATFFGKMALDASLACLCRLDYCADAVRRLRNLAAWDPDGATSYHNPGVDTAARYLTWVMATGYDWLHDLLSPAERAQLLAAIRARTAQMHRDLSGAQASITTAPRNSHLNQTLAVVAAISVLLAGDLPEAATWLEDTLPLALNALSPWGGEDGGFANAQAQGLWDLGEMLPLWYQLRLAAGIDVAQKPWVRHWGRVFTYFTPPGTPDGTTVFGDGFEQNESEHQARYGKGYVHFAPTPLGRWHAARLTGEIQKEIEYLMSPPADYDGDAPFPAGTPNALHVASVGQVAMHSDLSDPGRTSVYFKSSPPPYGAYNHSHADQNSFVINAGGQRLAIESGYYDGYKSAHWLNWYHTTKAKNAITFDGGQGQRFYEQGEQMGYGRITAFATTAGHDIVSGDATAAYGGALTRAQRTLVYLRPNLVLVYDNLASATGRQWEWNLHALNQMAVSSDTQVMLQAGGQKLCVSVLAAPPVRFAQSSVFSAAPTGSRAAQWHGAFRSATKSASAEFVVLMNVGCAALTASAAKATDGTWTVTLGERKVTIGATGAVTVAGAAGTPPAPEPVPTPTPTPVPVPVPTPTPTPTPAPALPSTNTRAVPTFESLGLYWTPPSDPGAAGCSVRYQKAGDTAWKDGLAMWYDARNKECRGSLVHLAPGTSYTVQFSLPGQAPVAQLTAATWKEAFPIAKTVTVASGSQTLAITEGGTATGYVLYTPAAGAQATIDVANARPYNVTIAAPYVIVRGLTLKGAQQDAIRLLAGARDVVIEDNDISGWGRFRANSSEGALGMDLDSAVRAVCADRTMERIVVQRNRIHDPRYTANSWSSGHPAGPQGINFEFCGGNHVIRHNEIVGGSNYFNDAIGGADNFTTTGFPDYDTDIYGNLIRHAWDDAIEAEGGNRNVRIWGNYMDQTTTGVATTVTAVGPVYIFRNVYNRSRQLKLTALDSDERNVFAKSGTQSATIGDGRRYLFHNTLLQATQSGVTNPLGAGGGIGNAGKTITNTVSRNNIFHIWKSHWQVIEGAGSRNDFGHDLYNGSLGGATETNGIAGTPIYQSGNGWVSESGGLYQLASNSPGFDRGARLANFNDGFLGAGPDVGAHEAGSPAMRFGINAGTPAPAPTPPGGTAPPPAPAPGGSTPYTGTPIAVPGTFEAEHFDKGGEGVAYRDTTATNLGGQFRPAEAVDLIASTDPAGGGYVVNNFAAGEWLNYTIEVAASGNYVIALRASHNYSATDVAFHIEIDGARAGSPVVVPKTGSWSTFQWVSTAAVPLTAGRHVLRVVADRPYFNLNQIRVTAAP